MGHICCLDGRVSRIAGKVVVFDPLLYRDIELRFYACPFQMAFQSAVACSEEKDGGLFVLWQLTKCILVLVVFSSFALEDGSLFLTDKSLGFSVRQM